MDDIELTDQTKSQPGVERNWIERWLPPKDAESRVVAINVVAQEITERKKWKQNWWPVANGYKPWSKREPPI